MDPSNSLKNHFLIAMPNLGDPNFYHAVTYICEHNDDGAMGIIINRPSATSLNEILSQMDMESAPKHIDKAVLEGGPVEPEHGFLIHSPKGNWQSSMLVTDEIALTTSRDILESLTSDAANCPEQFIVALGYAGWGNNQLEQEILENSWLTAPANKEILFELPYNERWQAAVTILGIDISQLSSQAGHA